MQTSRSLAPALYPRLIGTFWQELDEAVRRVHLNGESVRATGSLRVRHGKGWLARLLLWLFRMPPAAEAVETRLVITPYGHGEKWLRVFGNWPLVTMQGEQAGGLLLERFGVLEFRFRLEVAEGSLVYRQISAVFRLGPLSLPLPRWLAPHVAAREKPVGDRNQIHVSVEVNFPLLGPLIAYEGKLTRVEQQG